MILVYFLCTLLTFGFMEFVAWFTHKYVMHGFLWTWHRDHHIKKYGFFEKNDLFFLVFALPSIICFIVSTFTIHFWVFFIGLGIVFYGLTYFFVHDIFIHRRFKILEKTKNPYLKAIRKAHKIHHKHLTKHKGECFGMLFVPFKYYKIFLKR